MTMGSFHVFAEILALIWFYMVPLPLPFANEISPPLEDSYARLIFSENFRLKPPLS